MLCHKFRDCSDNAMNTWMQQWSASTANPLPIGAGATRSES